MTNPYLQKRSLRLSGHKTSVALEQEFWEILEQIALHKQQSLTSFITHVDTNRSANRPLSSALRLEALKSISILTK